MKTKSVLLTVVILFFVSNNSVASMASFQGLGDLPGGNFISVALAVSANGSVVAGYSRSASGYEAFRWENGQTIGLGDLPGGDFYSAAYGVSADGSVVVGYSLANDFPHTEEAFRWTYGGGMVGLGRYYSGSYAHGVSADGSVVVGGTGEMDNYDGEAFRWENGKMVYLGTLRGGHDWSCATGVSADGSVVVGSSTSYKGFDEAFRWENGQMVGLGDLPGDFFSSWAFDVSADGLVVVGSSKSTLGQEAFRWTAQTGMVGLGKLPGAYSAREYALDCSADGSIIVGQSGPDWSTNNKAFIWNAASGMRNLQDVLVNDCGLDLTGWNLYSARGISDDGLTIVGYGRNRYGNYEGWIATIPEPATMILLGFGALMMKRKRDR
jgi:probable HAF family extracellular repeat protein